MSDYKRLIGYNIAWQRKKKGLRQLDVSQMSDINYRYYQDIEAGKKNVTLLTLKKIANVLDSSLESLVTFNKIYLQSTLESFLKENQSFLNSFEGFHLMIRCHNKLVAFANKSFRETLENDSLVGAPVFDIIAPSDQPMFKSMMEGLDEGIICSHLLVRMKRFKSQDFLDVILFPLAIVHNTRVVGLLCAGIERQQYKPGIYNQLEKKLLELYEQRST